MDKDNSSIPTKATLVLNIILVAIFVIVLRIWHLAVIQYDEKFEESKKQERRTVVLAPPRATIRDQFNTPLAINKGAYRVAVTYAPIREQVPQVIWETAPDGKKIKIQKRKAYIKALAELLGDKLQLDSERLEDLIYSKAALYYTVPYVIQEEISETQYAELKVLEKDWPGLTVQRYFIRHYPYGKCGCDILGYMGAISREEYEKNLREKRALDAFLTEWENGENPPLPAHFESPQAVRIRLKELQELAYTPQDYVGKAGIEAVFEESLRGLQGKKSFYTDSRGKYLLELPGSKEPVPGKRIILNISQELQEYAEGLLAQNEEIRQAKSSGHGKSISNHKQPWIKGGAIVVIDPKNGDVLTLATYPRFDPNDFALKKREIHKWLEDDAYIASLWNQTAPLTRERHDGKDFYTEEKWMSWQNYLDTMLPIGHPILDWFQKEGTIKNIVKILKSADALEKEAPCLGACIRASDQEKFQKSELANHLSFLSTPYTKLLFIDLCQLAVLHTSFNAPLLQAVGQKTIQAHKDDEAAYFAVQEEVKQITKDIFHTTVFKQWRAQNEKSYLKEMREIEKASKIYPKPYLDYLDEKEAELFHQFYEHIRYDLLMTLLTGKSHKFSNENPFFNHFIILHQELNQGAHSALPWKKSFIVLQESLSQIPFSCCKDYLRSLRCYQDLTRPLKGRYRSLRNKKDIPSEKHLAAAFYPTYGYGYGRSYSYRQSSTQGSIFKLVTAYEALMQSNKESLDAGKGFKVKNPLEITDDIFYQGKQIQVGYTAGGKPIPQLYKGGRIPRSARPHLGKLDLLKAIEMSSNPYFSLLASDHLSSPHDLANAAKTFGFGKKTGIDLPGEIPGKVPDDLETNRTGLYAMAIGQHSLVVTPLQTAMMLVAIANHGDLLKPQIVKLLAGISPSKNIDTWLAPQAAGAAYTALGLDFPLFAAISSKKEAQIEKKEKEVQRHIAMPDAMRHILLEGMYRVVQKTHADSLSSLSRIYHDYPEAISDYVDLKNQLIGKTSTSESMERIDFDEHEGTNLYTHVWFGGIAFEKDVNFNFENPELIVVVYLRYGAYGKETAPVAAQMVQKWKEIKNLHK